MSTELLDYLRTLPGRCRCGAHVETQGCRCGGDEWQVFSRALRTAALPDGTVHVNHVRPLIRGLVAPKSIGTFYRRAKSLGLLVDVDRWEDSTDEAGGNTDKPARVYDAGPNLRSAA